MSDDAPKPVRTPEERQQRFVQRFLGGVPHLAALGISYRSHGPEWVELEMPFADQQLADPDYGIIASGAIFTLMDSAAGFSVHMNLNEFLPIATIDMRIDYLRGPAAGATVVGRASCYRLTQQIAFVRGIAHDGDPDRPIANMAGTFIIPRTPVAE